MPVRFQGVEPRSAPLPVSEGLSNAFRHRLRLRLPPRAFAPLMVELFTVGFFGRTPSVITRPVASVAADKLPTTAKVVRAILANEARTPWRDWFAARERHPFENHGCPRGQSVPVAQTPDNLKSTREPVGGTNLWDRDRRLIACWCKRFTCGSLPRTGRACLHASGSTCL